LCQKRCHDAQKGLDSLAILDASSSSNENEKSKLKSSEKATFGQKTLMNCYKKINFCDSRIKNLAKIETFRTIFKKKQGKQVAKGDFRLSDGTLSDFGVYDNEFEDKENKKSIDG
jgi:hypothetical protein